MSKGGEKLPSFYFFGVTIARKAQTRRTNTLTTIYNQSPTCCCSHRSVEVRGVMPTPPPRRRRRG